jgi:hypothetical protein
LPADKWLDVLRADDLHLMTESFELALPVEGASARFEDNRAAIDLGNDREKLIAHDSAL